MEIFLGTVNMFSVLKLNRDYLSRSEQCLVLFLLNVPDSIDNNVFYAYSQVLLCLEIYALLIRSVLHLLYFKFCAFHHWHTSSSALFLVSYSCLIPQFNTKDDFTQCKQKWIHTDFCLILCVLWTFLFVCLLVFFLYIMFSDFVFIVCVSCEFSLFCFLFLFPLFLFACSFSKERKKTLSWVAGYRGYVSSWEKGSHEQNTLYENYLFSVKNQD